MAGQPRRRHGRSKFKKKRPGIASRSPVEFRFQSAGGLVRSAARRFITLLARMLRLRILRVVLMLGLARRLDALFHALAYRLAPSDPRRRRVWIRRHHLRTHFLLERVQ